tara:strand:- start:41 stop:1882 length:1842 start_codon:yes stop_codon:yes gene_type:complete
MTFTPGSDEGRTDTFEAQTAEPDRSIDKTVEEDFNKAQTILKRTGEALYNLGLVGVGLVTRSPQAVQGVQALRAKIEGKPFVPPTANPNAPGLVNLEPITTEDAFTRPDMTGTKEQPIIEDVPQYPVVLQRILKVHKDNPGFFSGIVGRMDGGLDSPSVPPKGVKLRDDPIDTDAALFKAQSDADNLDVDQASPTFGQPLPNFGVPMPTQLANELRGQAADEIVQGMVANVNPSQKIALNKSITEIPGYKAVVGSPYYFDYNVIRQLIAGGTVAKQLGLRTRGVNARDFLEAFQTPVTVGGASRGVDFGTYRNMNVPKLREAFGPALDALGLPRNAAQIHHIAALHGISGIFHKLGYNSPIYREVVDTILAELPDFAKGIGSMSGNLMPIIAQSGDSPHFYAHLFYTDEIGKDGSKFFTPEVLENMVKSKNYRLQKAKELGQIIAQSERIASQAQTVYEQLYGQGTSIPFEEIMDVMMQLNIEGKLPRNIMSPRYQVKAIGNLIKDINLALEIEQLNPSLDAMLVLQTKNRRNVQILRDIIASGDTGEDAQKALNKLYGKPLPGGAVQTDFFEDIIDVENLLEKYRIEARNKRESAKERRNQAKYFEDPDVTR